jgi:hypothetical protein
LRPKTLAQWLLLVFVAFGFHPSVAQTAQQKIGELDLPIMGITATVTQTNPTIPKNTASAVAISVTAGGSALDSSSLAAFLGGSFQIQGELSGPGLSGTITLPYVDPDGGASPILDPLMLPIPALTEAGDYTLTNLRIVVNGNPVLTIAPSTITLDVIDQVLITSVQTTPLTLQQIQQLGIVLDNNSYQGFQFTVGLGTSSNVVNVAFPVVFDNNGVPVPQPISPPQVSRNDVPVPTIVPVLFQLTDSSGASVSGGVTFPDGHVGPVQIPGVIVIPGNVGYLKQFFSANLYVSNGAPSGSGLTVQNVTGTIQLPPGADGVVGTSDDPVSLPDLTSGPQPSTMPVLAQGPDGKPDVSLLNPGDQGQAQWELRGDKEGYYPINFAIQGTLNGLPVGAVTIKGTATGGVLIRNPYFDMTFAVPSVVRSQEQFNVYITVKNISQSVANALKVTLDAGQMSGAVLIGDASQQIDTLAAGSSQTLTFTFQSLTTGQVNATYLQLNTQNGSSGELSFTIGVGERGVPLSPDTLSLPDSVNNLPQPVIDAAMRVLGEGWSIANAPAGTLPVGVLRTTTAVVTQKALALAEAGLRVELGQPLPNALRDLLYDFFSGKPIDPGFDQLLRTTDAGFDFQRAIGAQLAQSVQQAGGPLAFEAASAQVLASGPDFLSYAVGNGSNQAPVEVQLSDATGDLGRGFGFTTGTLINQVVGFGQLPLGNSDASPLYGIVTNPAASPYTLQFLGTGNGTVDLSVTLPRGDGTFVHGQIYGATVQSGVVSRITLDLSQPDQLVLQQDPSGDATFPVQLPLQTEIISPQGPNFVSAVVIGPETIPGATPLGFHLAVLFDRVVDANTAKQTSNYQIPNNTVQAAASQLSGRIVIADMAQPEGPYIPTTVAVSGIQDSRGVAGPGGTQPLKSNLKDAGAVVSGRVFNADGSPTTTAVITYMQAPPADDCQDEEAVAYAGLTTETVDSSGHYQLRYVRQDPCGLPFELATTDPNTGSLRTLYNFVQFAGEQLDIDFPMFGIGTIAGTVKDLSNNPVYGAQVIAVSGTDPQVGGQAITDGNGYYSIPGITVGPVTVRAAQGNSMGVAAGNLPRAGNTTVINVTLDGGSASLSGVLQQVTSGTVTPIPNWPVVFSLAHPGTAAEAVAVVYSGADGSFKFAGVPVGQYVVSATLDPVDSASITGTIAANDNLVNQNLTIAVAASATIQGTVTLPGGAPSAYAVVTNSGRGVQADQNGNFSISVPVSTTSSQVISASSFDGLRNGSATVLANVAGATITGVNIPLSGVGSVQFQVLDANGKPMSSQSVGLTTYCGAPCGCDQHTTDVHGNARFDNLPLGAVAAKVVTTGFDVATGTAAVPSDGGIGYGVIRLSSVGSVTGTVNDPSGKPSFGANVALSSQIFDTPSCTLVPGVSQQIQTDQSGSFSFNNVHLGSVGVTASQTFYPTSVGANGVLTAPGQVLNFNLQLVNTIAGVLSGVVYLPDGVTPAGAGVQVSVVGPLPAVTVETDDQGNFAFAKILPAGSYTLTAVDPVSGGRNQSTIYLQAGQDVTNNIRLKGQGMVRVHVVDGSGNPVTSASVELQETAYPNETYDGVLDPATGIATFAAVFEGPISAQASDSFGRGGRASSTLTGPGATVDVTVQLTSVGTVTGHFLMPDGITPIPNATVTLTEAGRVIGTVTTQSTGDIGEYSFTYVPTGDIRLDAQDPLTARSGVGFGTIGSNGQSVTVDVVAQALGTIMGVVTEDGSPQAGAHVEILSGQFDTVTYADSQGNYSVSGVPAGNIVVTGSISNGFLAGTANGTLTVDGSTVEIDVALRGSGKVQGKVVESDGLSVPPPAVVTIQTGGTGGGTQSTTTDDLGNFEFDLVPAGAAALSVQVLNSIDVGSGSVQVPEGGSVPATVVLNGVGSINGLALDSNGDPIAGTVTVQGTGPFPYRFDVSAGTDGTFQLPQVLAGPFTATLQSSGLFALYGTNTGTVLPNKTADLQIQVQPSGTVTGVVLRADGVTPAIGANVSITVLGVGAINLQADDTGRFTSTGQPLGNFSVLIHDSISNEYAAVYGQKLGTNDTTVDLGTLLLDSGFSVVSVTPANGALQVSIHQPITLVFSDIPENMGAVTLTGNGRPLSYSYAASADGKTVTLNGQWPDGSPITVNVDSSLYDEFGRQLAASFTSSFQTVDLTPPSVIAITPAANAIQVNPATAAITVTFSKPLNPAGDLSSVISVNGPGGAIAGITTLSAPATAIFTFSSPLSSNAAYTVTVAGETDVNGNIQSTPVTESFMTIDTVPPVLQLLSPAVTGYLNNATPNISISLADNLTGVVPATAALLIDGVPVTASVTASSINYTPPAPLADGTHTIAASVQDVAGNTGTLAAASFSIDTTPPSVPQFAGLTANQVIRGVIPIAATSTDAGSGVDHIDVYDGAGGGGLLVRLYAPGFSGSFNTAVFGDGPHSLAAIAVDKAGNASAASTPLPIVVDNVPLTISITTPAAGTPFRALVPVAATVSKSVQQVVFTLGTQTVTVTAPPFQTTLDSTGVPEGTEAITATATDYAQNTATATVSILVDRTPPAAPNASLIYAEPPLNGRSHVHGSAGAAEALSNVTITDTANAAVSNLVALADGSFTTYITGNIGDTLSITATDAAGNVGPATSIAISSIPSKMLNGYEYRRAFVIDHTQVSNSDQMNFPVLISVNAPFLRSMAYGGEVENANGYDIVFAQDTAGAYPLDFEIDSYNASTGVANFWVNVPDLSSTTDTPVYMFYGNPNITASQENKPGVWQNGYAAVYHLGNSQEAIDSTGINNGTNYGVTPETGAIGNAGSFDGWNNYLRIPSNASYKPSAAITVQAWVETPTTGYWPVIASLDYHGTSNWTSPYESWEFGLNQYSLNPQFLATVAGVSHTVVAEQPLTANRWQLVDGRYDGQQLRMFINGAEDPNVTPLTGALDPGTSQDLAIGMASPYSPNQWWTGGIDELRISTVARSNDWIATEYNNQSSPATFYQMGEEATGNSAPAIDWITPNIGPAGETVTIWGVGFGSPSSASVVVSFNGTTVTPATWNDSSMQVQVPAGATTGPVQVTVNGLVYSGPTFTVYSSYPDAYRNRLAFVIDHTQVPNSDQANFPVLISITDASLRSVANGGQVESADGYDIVFASDVAGQNRLDHEIDTYNPASGAASFWVRIPLLSHTADTVVYMFYGNPSVTLSQQNPPGVWQNGYAAVYHFANNQEAVDSTEVNNGSNYGVTPVTGVIGNGGSFNGWNAYLRIPSNASYKPAAALTVQAWVNTPTTGYWPAIASLDYHGNSNWTSPYESWEFGLNQYSLNPLFEATVAGVEHSVVAEQALSENKWQMVDGRYDGQQMRMFINGVEDPNVTPLTGTLDAGTSQDLAIGVASPYSLSQWWSGGIDELRISTVARSNDWIATEYNNQSAPTTFYRTGSPATSTSAPGIDFVSPNTGPIGETATIWGIGFGSPSTGSVIVSFNGATVTPSTWNDSSIQVQVPAGATTGAVQVTVNGVAAIGPTFTVYTSYPDTYRYRRAFVIDHTQVPNSDQTNFPVLISITDPSLRSVANGGNVEDANGYDIVFASDVAGQSPLDYEIDTYNPATGAASFWIRIPALSHTADTAVYMFYGNPSVTLSQQNPPGVWQNGYAAVYHFASSLEAVDSTGINSGADYGVVPETGIIGNAGSFNGNNSYLRIPSNASYKPAAALTVQAWVNTPSTGYWPAIASLDYHGNSNWTSPYESWEFGLNQYSLNPLFVATVAGVSHSVVAEQALGTNKWQMVDGRYDGQQLRLFINGAEDPNSTTLTGALDTGTSQDLAIGVASPYAPSQWWNGGIDELRISTVARSNDWIATEYNNQSAPTTFCRTGSPATSTSAPGIDFISPNTGPVGETVTIWGIGFGSPSSSSLVVSFNGATVTPATWNDSSIQVQVPAGATTGAVQVTVNSSVVTGPVFTVYQAYANDYGYSRTIVLSHAQVPNTDQTNFPVLISLTESDLAGVAQGGKVFSADGYDIIFCLDANCVTRLDHEIESYNPATGAAIFWVRIPTLSHSSDTPIYMFYSNPAVTLSQQNPQGVWENGYAAVYHFANNLEAVDSTGVNSGTEYNVVPETGIIGNASSFNGSNSYLRIPSNASFKPAGALTVQAWVETPNTGYWPAIASLDYHGNSNWTTPYESWEFGLNQYSLNPLFVATVAGVSHSVVAAQALSTNKWQMVAGRYDGQQLRLFINGAEDPNATALTGALDPGSSQDLAIGVASPYAPSQWWSGGIDELRISTVARSNDWITTEYNNQSSPATFYTVGAATTPGQ